MGDVIAWVNFNINLIYYFEFNMMRSGCFLELMFHPDVL